MRSAGSIARHYTVWLLISGLFSHLLSWTLVFVIVWRSRQETETIASTVERGDRLYFGILIAGLTAFFWLWGGWWYGGKRLSRYYVFQSHAEVLNHLALLSIVVMMVSLVGAIASAPGVLLLGNPTFYIPGFVFSLVVWAAIWYGLGWVCLPVGWRCECQQLMEDGKYEKVIDLLTTVATSEELSPEDAHTLDLAEQRFKNSNIAVGNGPESAR